MHDKSKLSLGEGLNKQSEEVKGEQGLNGPLVVEKYGCNLMHGLNLFEAFLGHRLPLMSLKHFSRRQFAIIGHLWMHSVAFVIVDDGLLVGAPLDVKTPFGDLAISGLGPRPASPWLWRNEYSSRTVRLTLR